MYALVKYQQKFIGLFYSSCNPPRFNVGLRRSTFKSGKSPHIATQDSYTRYHNKIAKMTKIKQKLLTVKAGLKIPSKIKQRKIEANKLK